MNSTKHAIFAICALASIAALAAEFPAGVTYEGRLIDASGKVQSNTTLTATLRAYETEGAETSFAAQEGLSISTDAAGFFAATATIPVPPALQSFWIGVTPDGGSEIRPRMHVLPVPFAIKAFTAERLDSKDPLEFRNGRQLYANGFANEIAATVTNAELRAKASLCGNVQGAAKINIEDLDLGGGHLSMLRTKNLDGITSDWDSFTKDGFLCDAVDAIGGGDKTMTRNGSVDVEDDGFATVFIRTEAVNPNLEAGDYVHMTISNGDFTIGDGANFISIKNNISTTENVTKYITDRILTFPVRKGRQITGTLKAHAESSDAIVIAEVAYKMFYFGAN